MAQFKGGCLCGAVRYAATAEPIFSGVCHCTNCQKHTGSAFSCVIAVPKPALSITGRTGEFRHKGDSGKDVITTFCPVCASRLTSEATVMAGVVMIEAGTLDDPGVFEGKTHIYCASAQPWVAFPEGAARFPTMPPMAG
ncbi:MAG: GFA family protein [Acetobacteraceae bacterium]|nr:GFA family protein [Acetobacteraceae bacterium]